MEGSGPNREEFVRSQREDHFVKLERRRDHEANQTPSVHINHTSRSHSTTRSHVSHDEETRNLGLEIYHLHKKLRRKQQEASPSS